MNVCFVKDVLARSAFKCQAYTRSLLYLELFLREKPADFQKNVGFLQVFIVTISRGVDSVYMNIVIENICRTR